MSVKLLSSFICECIVAVCWFIFSANAADTPASGFWWLISVSEYFFSISLLETLLQIKSPWVPSAFGLYSETFSVEGLQNVLLFFPSKELSNSNSVLSFVFIFCLWDTDALKQKSEWLSRKNSSFCCLI